MSYILSFAMGVIGLLSMVDGKHSWQEFMSAWGLCALFALTGHIGRFVSILEDKNNDG